MNPKSKCGKVTWDSLWNLGMMGWADVTLEAVNTLFLNYVFTVTTKFMAPLYLNRYTYFNIIAQISRIFPN